MRANVTHARNSFFARRGRTAVICQAIAALMLATSVSTHATAQATPAPAPPAPTTPSSGEDFTGDKIVLKSNMRDLEWLGDGTGDWIALRGTVLRVTRYEASAGSMIAVVTSVPCVVTEKENEELTTARDRVHLGVGGLIDCPTDQAEIERLVRVDEIYRVHLDVLQQHGYYRSGWVYGALLVPYKYHFHDKSFSSATTIGPYLGYRMGGLGFETAFVTSIGLSSLAVANPNGGGDTSTIQGFSFAIGIIGNANKNNDPMTFGVLFGRDWAGSNSAVPYTHEGRTWAAVQIGFSFSK